MADLRKVIRGLMNSLIYGQLNDFDAAAMTINARTDQHVCKGTISKRDNGHLGWPVDDVIALEDACKCYPVTRYMYQRVENADVSSFGPLITHVGSISKEVGEAINAVIAAHQSNCKDDKAQALVEIAEAKAALSRAEAVLENDQ